MGMNVHHSVASVSMEILVERRLDASKDSRVSYNAQPFAASCKLLCMANQEELAKMPG